jgi:hypothetical protein
MGNQQKIQGNTYYRCHCQDTMLTRSLCNKGEPGRMRTLRVSLINLLSVLFLHQEALAITIATGSQEGTYYKIAQDIK